MWVLLWAFGVLCRHHKRRGRISSIAIFLLLSDLLELILIPFLVAYLFKEDSKPCELIFSLLFGARLYGNLLHQIVAVESISQRYPSLGEVFSPSCSIILCIVVFLLLIGCRFIYLIGNVIIMLVCVLPIIVCAVTYLLTWKAPHDLNQAIDRKPGVLVLTVAMFTLIILYMPFFLTVCTDLPFMLDSLASLRLISDPLLCVLVCRELGSSVPRTHRSITIN